LANDEILNYFKSLLEDRSIVSATVIDLFN